MIKKFDEYRDTDSFNQNKNNEIRFKLTDSEFEKFIDCKREFLILEDASMCRRLIRRTFFELQKEEPFKSLWTDKKAPKGEK